jgi:hypothetical protein
VRRSAARPGGRGTPAPAAAGAEAYRNPDPPRRAPEDWVVARVQQPNPLAYFTPARFKSGGGLGRFGREPQGRAAESSLRTSATPTARPRRRRSSSPAARPPRNRAVRRRQLGRLAVTSPASTNSTSTSAEPGARRDVCAYTNVAARSVGVVIAASISSASAGALAGLQGSVIDGSSMPPSSCARPWRYLAAN